MGGVRAVAAVFGLVSWVILLLYAAFVLFVLTQLGARVGFLEVASSLALGLLGSMVTFAIWAGLTGLCELHALDLRILTALEEDWGRGRARSRAAARSQRVDETVEEPAAADTPDWAFVADQVVITIRRADLFGDGRRPGDVAGSLEAGTECVVVSTTGNWARVRTKDGRRGFVLAEDLEPD